MARTHTLSPPPHPNPLFALFPACRERANRHQARMRRGKGDGQTARRGTEESSTHQGFCCAWAPANTSAVLLHPRRVDVVPVPSCCPTGRTARWCTALPTRVSALCTRLKGCTWSQSKVRLPHTSVALDSDIASLSRTASRPYLAAATEI